MLSRKYRVSFASTITVYYVEASDMLLLCGQDMKAKQLARYHIRVQSMCTYERGGSAHVVREHECLVSKRPWLMLSHSFFPLFDKYIYNLVTTIEDIRLSTLSVLRDFANDGVVYLELRTTPRSIPDAGVTKETYVSSVLDTIDAFNAQQDKIKTYLILSIDRRNNTDQADEVVDLALRYTDKGVLGVDLCGNPLCGDVSIFQPAFARAKAGGLNIALHFGEVPTSGTKEELQTLLSYGPQRLGHVICVPEEIKSEVLRKRLALELCLSCNVLAKLSMGGFADHHFGEWRKTNCPIALSVCVPVVSL